MRFYDISKDYAEFLTAVESGEIPLEAMADTLEALDMELNEKADNTACVIKELLSDAAAIKAEEAALQERRKAKEEKAEYLKGYLSSCLRRAGVDKVETARNRITFRKSAALEIEDREKFVEKYPELCTLKTVWDIPKAEITKAIKAGRELEGAALVERQNIQIK